MRTKTVVCCALSFTSAISVALMILALFLYEDDFLHKFTDEDHFLSTLEKMENSITMFYTLYLSTNFSSLILIYFIILVNQIQRILMPIGSVSKMLFTMITHYQTSTSKRSNARFLDPFVQNLTLRLFPRSFG